MPIYVYQAINQEHSCNHCGSEFEIFQSMAEQPLSACPQCGAQIHRIIQPVGVTMGKKHLLDDGNLKKHGFTKLVNEGSGKFRKL